MSEQLQVNSASEYSCSPDWYWYPGRFQDLDMWLVCSGNGKAWLNKDTYELSRGSCFLFRPGVQGYIEHDKNRPLHVLAVHFSGLTENESLPNLYRHFTEIELLETLLYRLIQAYQTQKTVAAKRWLGAAVQTLQEADNDIKNRFTAPYEKLLKKFCKDIRQEPHRWWSVSELAEQAGVCPDHFSRIFREAIGIGPEEFIISSRLAMVKKQLRFSNLPLKRIAELCGYNTVQFFNRQFKDKTGITPGQFRRDYP